MQIPRLDALRDRPGFVGSALAVAVLFVDVSLGVSVHDVAVVLLVAGVVAAIWGDGDARTAGTAVVVAGAATLVGAAVLAELPVDFLGLVALVVALSLVGVASR